MVPNLSLCIYACSWSKCCLESMPAEQDQLPHGTIPAGIKPGPGSNGTARNNICAKSPRPDSPTRGTIFGQAQARHGQCSSCLGRPSLVLRAATMARRAVRPNPAQILEYDPKWPVTSTHHFGPYKNNPGLLSTSSPHGHTRSQTLSVGPVYHTRTASSGSLIPPKPRQLGGYGDGASATIARGPRWRAGGPGGRRWRARGRGEQEAATAREVTAARGRPRLPGVRGPGRPASGAGSAAAGAREGCSSALEVAAAHAATTGVAGGASR